MSTAANPPIEVDYDQYRLPTNVKATHYDVAVKTDLQSLTFQGFVKISLDIVVGASAITLNLQVSNLDLGTASLTSNALAGLQELTVSAVDKIRERTTFQLSRNLPAGSKAEIHIAFSGEITGSMMGYYKSSHEVDGKTKSTDSG